MNVSDEQIDTLADAVDEMPWNDASQFRTAVRSWLAPILEQHVKAEIAELKKDAERWGWARSKLLSASFASGKHDSGITAISKCFNSDSPEYWDDVADRNIAAQENKMTRDDDQSANGAGG